MLHLFQSNYLETLAERLGRVLAVPCSDPLVSEIVVVQNVGMGRWLSRHIARHAGIVANIHFPLPARFAWQVLAGQLEQEGGQANYDRGVLRWRVLMALAGLVEDPAFIRIRTYLQGDVDGRKTFHLAGVIADLFDKYLVYRPDMLLGWESGKDEGWQAILWRQLAEAGGQHRAGQLRIFLDRFKNGNLDVTGLPERVCLFGIGSLAPVYLEVIHAVSMSVDVYLFHLSPCRQYWGDLVSDGEMAKKRRNWRRRDLEDVSRYFETGNPLLASFGQVGREFMQQLAELDAREHDCYREPAGATLLAQLQRDLLDLRNPSDPSVDLIPVSADDRSVQFHSCYSRMREVQVLHDHLLALFEKAPDLAPGAVLVMAPDIEAYAPAVRAVFNGGDGGATIPWSMADLAARTELPMVDAFLQILALAESRCSAPEVLALLETDPVRRCFAITDEEVEVIRGWVRDSGIRWGLDPAHRHSFAPAMEEAHSWQFGMDRLFLGYFGGPAASMFEGVAPCGAMNSERAGLLGRLARFLDLLQKHCAALRREQAPEHWGDLLLRIMDDFFGGDGGEEDLEASRLLRETIYTLVDDCGAAGYDRPLSLTVVRSWFDQAFAEPGGGRVFPGGRVTVCNMVPMRSVPFDVICLLGMNDTDFPRQRKPVSFDLMATEPRPGDRNRRNDDRYLFLEAMISARKTLYISWVGQSLQDNSVRPPSVVVAELLDYLERGYRLEDGRSLVTLHPAQPFSPRCFDPDSGPVSYAAQWFPGAGEPVEAEPFAEAPLPETETGPPEVDLEQLKRFWSHPVRFFLHERLGVNLRAEDTLLPENEPFDLDHLEHYALISRLVREPAENRDSANWLARLRAEGVLPHGGFGDTVLREARQVADALEERFAGLLAGPRDRIEFELPVGQDILRGLLDSLYAGGCVRFRPARLKGRDMIRLWIDHLVLNCLAPAGVEPVSHHVARDKTLCLGPVGSPAEKLEFLLHHYRRGLRQPLHFFPETSRAWAEAKEDRREARAYASWNGGYKRRGEAEDSAYAVGLRGRDPLDDSFRKLAAGVFGPLLSCRES